MSSLSSLLLRGIATFGMSCLFSELLNIPIHAWNNVTLGHTIIIHTYKLVDQVTH